MRGVRGRWRHAGKQQSAHFICL